MLPGAALSGSAAYGILTVRNQSEVMAADACLLLEVAWGISLAHREQ